MKQFITAVITLISVSTFANNEVKISEESEAFSVGSKNAIVVTIPHGKADIVEKELRNELKDWGGKYSSAKGEYKMMQGKLKALGSKPFDAYAKIIVSGDVVKVAVGIDLGGAFLSSREHGAQYTAMCAKLKEFAIKASNECVDEELKAEQKILSTHNKQQKSLEKEKESLLTSIEDYKKRILEAEKKIEENIKLQETQKGLIETQGKKVAEVEEKKKNIR
jgi:hypothetical protein